MDEEKKEIIEEDQDPKELVQKMVEEEDENNHEVNELTQIEQKLLELDILLEKIEERFIDEEGPIIDDEYQKLKEEKKELAIKRKKILKATSNSFWDKIKLWMVIYAVIQTIICFPLILFRLSFGFVDIFGGFINNVPNINVQYILLTILLLAMPMIIEIISWLLYLNIVKSKFDKKVFKGIWIWQSFLILITIVWALLILFK